MNDAARVNASALATGYLLDLLDNIHWRNGGSCGAYPACLGAIVLTLEPQCKARRLLDALPANEGMDDIGLMNTMANLGYFTRHSNMRINDIDTRLLPCLFIPKDRPDTPMAVLYETAEGLAVYSGTTGKVKIASARNRLQGTAFFFTPFDRHRQSTSKFIRSGAQRTWFRAVVNRFKGTFRHLMGLCFALNIITLAPALFVMFTYDRIVSPDDPASLTPLAVGAFIALAIEWAMRSVRSTMLGWLTARMDNVVGNRIFGQMLSLPPETIENASVASQIARIKTFESVRDFFSSPVFLSALETPFIVLAIGLMWLIGGSIVFVPLAMILAYAVVFFTLRARVKSSIRLAAKASSARQQFTIETFEKLRSLRINGLGEIWRKKHDDITGRDIIINFHLGYLGIIGETLAHALTVFAALMTVSYGAHLIWAGSMTAGALVASMMLVWRILMPFHSLCSMVPRLEHMANAVKQINTLMEMEAEQDIAETTAVLPKIQGEISLDTIEVRYEKSISPILSGFDLHIKVGECIGLQGHNGSGKSSVLKLIKGMLHQTQGSVRIDGFDIRQIDINDLRQKVSYVPQKPDFFPSTVAENILIGNPFATEDDMRHALERADAWNDVCAMENGLKTHLVPGTTHVNLAAKLSLARMYLHDGPVVLIDELPNAVLNGAAGDNLLHFIRQNKGKKTIIFAAHRRDMLSLADTVVTLERGKTPLTTHPTKDIHVTQPREVA